MSKDSSIGRIAPSEITPRHLFDNRRAILKAGAAGLAYAPLGLGGIGAALAASGGDQTKLAAARSALSSMERPTTYADATSYNNFYEFGTDKADPARYAHTLKIRPWTISVEGEVNRPKVFDIDELLRLAPLEERIYRLRCVEGWSMVIPWVGYSFSEIIRRVEPRGNAKFVEFTTLADPRQMPGLSSEVLQWPYVEGLRIDEASHRLTLLTLGVYGQTLPRQNGAPVRLVVPWKYGFKSAKSIVRIRFVEQQPITSWNRSAPYEYGFYSNVNPEVDHPRWSQARERRIGEDGFLQNRRKTLMFNGYGAEVAALYTGMDLRRQF